MGVGVGGLQSHVMWLSRVYSFSPYNLHVCIFSLSFSCIAYCWSSLRNFLYVVDVAEAFLEVLHKGQEGDLFIDLLCFNYV